MMTKARYRLMVFTVVLMAAATGGTLFWMREALAASCVICFSNAQPKCDVADNTSGDFGYNLTATSSTFSYSSAPTLLVAVNQSNSVNIVFGQDTPDVNPDSFTLSTNGTNNSTTTVTGSLSTPTQEGKVQTSWVVNSSEGLCSASWDTRILPNGSSCP